MIELEKLREIIQMMADHDLSEVSLRDGEESIKLRRGASPGHDSVGVYAHPPTALIPMPSAHSAAGTPAEAPTADIEPGLLPIKSPMVGTFYAAPDPNSPPFVTVGALVHPDTIVCVIEAMKVFNEIKADVSGTIAKVLVGNEEPVEYGQPLFLVRPRT
ncbi:MAG TPA: acetyl-CoA carboxylase biotin carboxyl carrier protein [Phycisphaerae bacterium]